MRCADEHDGFHTLNPAVILPRSPAAAGAANDEAAHAVPDERDLRRLRPPADHRVERCANCAPFVEMLPSAVVPQVNELGVEVARELPAMIVAGPAQHASVMHRPCTTTTMRGRGFGVIGSPAATIDGLYACSSRSCIRICSGLSVASRWSPSTPLNAPTSRVAAGPIRRGAETSGVSGASTCVDRGPDEPRNTADAAIDESRQARCRSTTATPSEPRPRATLWCIVSTTSVIQHRQVDREPGCRARMSRREAVRGRSGHRSRLAASGRRCAACGLPRPLVRCADAAVADRLFCARRRLRAAARPTTDAVPVARLPRRDAAHGGCAAPIARMRGPLRCTIGCGFAARSVPKPAIVCQADRLADELLDIAQERMLVDADQRDRPRRSAPARPVRPIRCT